MDLLNARELHYQLITLYPSLNNVHYQLCRAGGPSHQVILPLSISDSAMEPSLDRPFTPYFTVEQLKALIGRKGRLYLRPLQEVARCTRVSQVEVCYLSLCTAACCIFILCCCCCCCCQAYTPRNVVKCINCTEDVRLIDVPDHMYLCSGERTNQSEMQTPGK